MANLVFIWDNFGPLHADRCNAVGKKFGGRHQVIGLELAGQSGVYDWLPESGTYFKKETLVNDRAFEDIPFSERLRKTLSACLSAGRDAQFFLCHYQDPAILVVATVLRLMRRRVYTMGCSKFDDKERRLRKEFAKRIFYSPYNGAIASGVRSRDYMRFLGLPESRIESSYNSVSLDRIRALAGTPPAPDGVPFEERHFTIVARMVAKKNVTMALKAMALYAKQVTNPRPLHIFGNGPLETELRQQVRVDGIAELVHFRGFLQANEICQAYGTSLALFLPSFEEQFGNVVPEALSMGVPVILSQACGACDMLVRSGVNGFVVEPDNPTGMAYFMQLLSMDQTLWRRMCIASRQFAEKGNSEHFAQAVEALVMTKER